MNRIKRALFIQLSCKSKTHVSLSETIPPAVYAVHLLCVPIEYMKVGVFTYADRWAGLPVVSVIHLYTGYFVVPLELVSWVTLKGH